MTRGERSGVCRRHRSAQKADPNRNNRQESVCATRHESHLGRVWARFQGRIPPCRPASQFSKRGGGYVNAPRPTAVRFALNTPSNPGYTDSDLAGAWALPGTLEKGRSDGEFRRCVSPTGWGERVLCLPAGDGGRTWRAAIRLRHRGYFGRCRVAAGMVSA